MQLEGITIFRFTDLTRFIWRSYKAFWGDECYRKCLIKRTFLLYINCVSSQINMKNESYDVENSVTKKKSFSKGSIYLCIYTLKKNSTAFVWICIRFCMNKDECDHSGIWVVGTTNQLFIRIFQSGTKFSNSWISYC